jgi:hypothetical protein
MAHEGSQYTEIDSYGNNSNSSISQTLTTAIGQIYELFFAYSARINQSIISNRITLWWKGVSLNLNHITALGSIIHS